MVLRFVLGAGLAVLASAQFPPTPSVLTVATSRLDDEVTISYKQADICENGTYSGYVHIPGSLAADLGGYDMSVYFMYFEARDDPRHAPLAVYPAGGPGEASSYAALNSENGPCAVNREGAGTAANPWSFNSHVNMLYVDQPAQVGFSYSSLVRGAFNSTSLAVTPNATGPGQGTFADQASTANSTVASARGLWAFAEHWLSSFPGYRTSSNDVSFWGNSYAGFYVPEVAATASRALGRFPAAHPLAGLRVDSVGVTNGCVDFYHQMEGFPEYANNNTYGVKFYDDALYREIRDNVTRPGGCLDQTERCRSAGRAGDPGHAGANATVNRICADATLYCDALITPLYTMHNVSNYDIAIRTPGTCAYYLTVGQYLNRPEVQSALGVPLNWTWYALGVTDAFAATGDSFRQYNLPNLEYLLGEGVKVAFVYGDRDYTCPGTGAERLAGAVPWGGRRGFADAGYEELRGLGASARGGVARQHGRLSFTRVFEAGHQVSAYAPETVLAVFNRTIFGRGVVSGNAGRHHTRGPRDSSGWRSRLPGPFVDVCMVGGRFSSSKSFAQPDY